MADSNDFDDGSAGEAAGAPAAHRSAPAGASDDGTDAAGPRPTRPARPARSSREGRRIIHFMSGDGRLAWGIAGKALLVGVAAGVFAVTYRMLLRWGSDEAAQIYRYLRAHAALIPLWCLAAVAVGLLIGWAVRRVPMASGSGIPQVEGILTRGLSMRALPVLAVRFLGGGACSLFGLSLGREGPSIQIGAAAGQAVSRPLTRNGDERRCLMAAGAAAGLSAAFNAPLSGMMFALEELYRSFSPLVLTAALTASLVADFISKYWFSLTPVLDFSSVPQMDLWYMLLMIPFGALMGLVGALVNWLLLGAQSLYGRLPQWSRAPIALLLSVPVGLLCPLALGGGEALIVVAEGYVTSAGLLFLYFAVKTLFTATSFGSGVPGGIFMPILSIGALAGGVVGVSLRQASLIPSHYVTAFVVYGMAAALAASVKAPVTSILLVMEMTGSMTHMLPVAVSVLMAVLVSDALRVEPIYRALLDRYVRANAPRGAAPEPEGASGGSGFMEVPVEPGSRADGLRVSGLNLPDDVMLVGVVRDGSHMIPYASTRLTAGDYLVVMYPRVHEPAVHAAMTALCRR